jgi:alpha-tubulin suppressor-like RCC1 family protein/phosphoribosyl-AMP cyclohydrolase
MKKLYSVLLFLISVTLFAQTYTFTTFNTNNSGIAANNVNDFKMSSSGTLWIATNNGLSKMVGNNFTNYTTSNSAIGTNMLNKVAVAGTTVWVSTYGNGVIRYNGTTFTNFNTNQQGMPNNTATGIATDGQGTLWMASSSGLSKYNGSTWTTYNTSNSQIWSNNVTSVAVDAGNNVLVSAGGMLQKFNGTTFTTVTDGVMSILKVTASAIYVNTGDGLGKIVNNQFSDLYWPNSSCLASCSINAVGLDEANKLWLGLDSCGNYAGGVQNFTNCITYTTSNSGLPHNSITSLHVVDSNVIWAGTLEGGLVRMNKTDSPPCNAPTGLNVAQFGQNSAYLAWTAANPAPANGYIYRYSTVNNVAQGIESSTSQPGAGIDQLQPGTTYYWWVASACEPLNWVAGGSFTTQPAPTAQGCWKTVEIGLSEFTVAIHNNGTLWSWGKNTSGQLGNGTYTNVSVPTITGNDNTWAKIAAGNNFVLAIKNNGTLWGWGYNLYGQLGDGTNVNKNVPVQIGTGTDWAYVAAGDDFTLAIKTNGTLWGWGNNGSYQLGDGTTVSRNTPVQIGTATNWKMVTAGFRHSVGVRTNGTLWAWGENNFGQLGDGTQTDRTTPTQITTATNWSEVRAGYEHTMALKTNGTLWGWGYNLYGAVGNGTLVVSVPSPVQVGTGTWSAVRAGREHTLAIKTDGTLWGWGYNGSGELGTTADLTTKRTNPEQIGTANNWHSVAATQTFSYARNNDGVLYNFGRNYYGQLGNGTTLSNVNAIAPLACPQVTSTCNAPTQPYVAQFGQTSAYLAWTAANPAPSGGYIYRYSTVNNVTGAQGSSTTQTGAGIDQLQPNTTYYWWVASACEPLTWVSGGSFTTQPAPVNTCNAPTQPYVAQFGQTTAQLAWTAANPVPEGGYLYRYATVNDVEAALGGTTTQTGAGIDQLQPNTTYYWWVASACVPLVWVPGGTFTTQAPAASGCTSAFYGLFPNSTFTPACTASNEQIVNNSWAGEYSNVNVLANKQYTFTSSITTDFLTITNTAGTVVYASGQTPLSWASGTTSGVIRYYIHTNANCGNQDTSRIRYVKCEAAAATCGVPTALSVTNITSNSSRLNWSAPATAPASYDLYIVTANTAPTANTTATVTSTTAGIGVLSGLTPSTTYYYWIRSNCGSVKSAWVSGGSFTTIAALTCNGASNGLYPDATFTPACTGTNEQIVADAYAGEYTNVNTVANKQYTFISSIATDYITITNANGTIVYASGQTPITWSSANTSGVIRYYLHSNANCGSQESSRVRSIKCVDAPVQTCAPPTNPAVSNITSNSVRLDWNAPATAPNSYEVYVSANSTPPGDTTAPTDAAGVTNIRVLANLSPATTYYYWVRSVCGSSKSVWVSGGSFTTIAALVCNGAFNGLWPAATFTPACTGANEQIVANAWGGEYSNVNVIANKQYTFTSSVATDYLTITNATGTVVLASGVTPLVWNSGTTAGVIRYHLHTNANCGNNTTDRVRYIKCADLPGTPCAPPSNPLVSYVTSNSASIQWTAGTTSPSSYEIYYSPSNIAPGANTTPTAISTPSWKVLTGLTSSTTYYYWVRRVCSADSKSVWVPGGSFTTIPQLSCNGATNGLYPEATFTPACTGVDEVITTTAFAGDFTNVNVLDNKQYTFSSSTATDYITITNAAGTVVYASGQTPVVWLSGNNSGVIRYYLHSNANCGDQNTGRTRSIKCANAPVTVCGVPGVPSATNITSNSARIWWTAPATAPSNYDVYISTSSTWPEYNANPTASPMSSILLSYSPLAASTTYYYWVRSVCGSSKSDWVPGGSFTTLPALTCNGAMFGLYPEDTVVLQNTGSPEAVAYQSMAGQYSNVGVAANKQYQFTSSIATDYITITNEAGTTVLASGQTPLTWTSGNTPVTVRFYLHANANCGPDDMPRDKFAKAGTLGINDYVTDNQFKVYPNPTMGQFNVDTGSTIADKIMIFDNVGRVISTHIPVAGKTTLTIDSLSEGVYHVKVYYQDRSSTQKLVLKKN